MLVEKGRETRKTDIINNLMNGFDLRPLESKLSEICGTNVSLKMKIVNLGNYSDIEIYSEQEFKDFVGFLSNSLRSVEIKDFGVRLYQVIQFDNEKTKLKDDDITVLSNILYINIDARYHLLNGGSNGIHLISAQYNFTDKTWQFN